MNRVAAQAIRAFSEYAALEAYLSRNAMLIDMILGAGAGDEARRQAIEVGTEIGRTTTVAASAAIRATMQRFTDTVMQTGSGWVSCGQKPLTMDDLITWQKVHL